MHTLPAGWVDVAETFDAAARLSDGAPGVADIEQYVLACRSLGYRHPDLTEHPAQVHEWYAAENGMDLGALDADCAELEAAARAAEDALTRQEAQIAVLTTAWQGVGADASREFLRRHGEAANVAATAVRSAATALADLRERLWRAVDEKVAKVLAVADGVQGRRADWLAAAHTVTTGAGDRAAASELVDQEVKPFVDAVVGGEWVAQMRAATEAIDAAYQEVTAELASKAGATFDVPGELGPAWKPPARSDGDVTAAMGAATAPVVPAGWGASAAAPPPVALSPSPAATPVPLPAPPAAAPPPAEPLMPQSAATPSLPSLGTGLPDFGGGLSSLGQQLGEMLSGLLGDGSPGDAIDDDELQGLTEPDIEELGKEKEKDDETEADEVTEDGGDVGEVTAEPDDSVDPAAEEPMCVPEIDAAPPEEPAATVPPEPVPPEPVPPEPVPSEPGLPEPLAAPPESGGTPCEIAADELPQVGE